jgi:hypothetical protein
MTQCPAINNVLTFNPLTSSPLVRYEWASCFPQDRAKKPKVNVLPELTALELT